jgi:hypothetical protein
MLEKEQKEYLNRGACNTINQLTSTFNVSQNIKTAALNINYLITIGLPVGFKFKPFIRNLKKKSIPNLSKLHYQLIVADNHFLS